MAAHSPTGFALARGAKVSHAAVHINTTLVVRIIVKPFEIGWNTTSMLPTTPWSWTKRW
jgi:hypothetical protein